MHSKTVMSAFTPFKSRNQSFSCPRPKDSETKQAIKNLSRLLNKKWYIFNVSPLYNVEYNEVCFKRYARRLKEKLMSRVTDESDIEFEVTYSAYPNLQLNSFDHEAIQISVVKIADTGKRSIAYNGILLSWGATRSMQPVNAIFLPILICSGFKGVIRQVHEEFQLVHDCFINSFNMIDDELRNLTAVILECSSNEKSENSQFQCKLAYSLPSKVKSDSLHVSFTSSLLSTLWKCIREGSPEECTEVEVQTFWRELHFHFLRSFDIDLRKCGLLRVSLPDITFTQEAVLVKKKNTMFFLLKFLMSLIDVLSSVTAPL